MLNEFSSFKVLAHYDKLLNITKNLPLYPITFTIDPTNKCNQDCDFCLNSSQRKKHNRELPLSKIKDILDLAKNIGVKGIKIDGGGEPLLYSRIFELLDLLKLYRAHFEYALVTNGTLMTPDIADKLNDIFDYIDISAETFNSSKYFQIRQSNKLEVLLKNIIYFVSLKSKTKLNLNLVIHQLTYMDIFETATTAKLVGFDTIFIKPLSFNRQFKYNYLLNKRILQSQLLKTEELGCDTFNVILSSDRSNSSFFPIHKYEKCKAIYLTGIWGADGLFHLCADRRNDRLHLFNFMKEDVFNFKDHWGSKEHLGIVNNILPSKQCPSCSLNPLNNIIDDMTQTDILVNLI